jgi:RHS repeat-associated protein
VSCSVSCDKLNRLKQISSAPSASSAVSYTYKYNSANQREKATLADSSHWDYGYDPLGQVISGKKHFADNSLVPGQQFEYSFDDIGNRIQTGAGGNADGGNLRPSYYLVNELNQYEARSVPSFVEVQGELASAATVIVNDQPTDRRGSYYRRELSVDNDNGPVWFGITNLAAMNNGGDVTNRVTGHVFVPQSPEIYDYDWDGNLIRDGRWNYSWDGENRLVKMESMADVPPEAKQRLEFAYDWQGRRIWKRVSNWDPVAGQYAVVSERKFVYDGWNLLAEFDALNAPSVPTLTRSYAWGSDLSGTPRGAGGVGGLLFISDMSSGIFYSPAYDGNGNVAALVSMADGTVSAHYEYGPFGELLRATGPMAKANPFRFSTKYQDDETDQLYYGYRYCCASTGRWLSRDPQQEGAGANLYGFVRNDPCMFIDMLGLQIRLPGGKIVPDEGVVLWPPPTSPTFDPTGDSAFNLFFAWVGGTTSDQINFRDGDPMAEQMKVAPEVLAAEADFSIDLFGQAKCGDPIPTKRVSRYLGGFAWYQHIGYGFWPLYGESIWWDMGHNPARAFLGSFDGRADLIYVNCCQGKAIMEVHLWDRARLGSATHAPWNYNSGGGLPDIDGPFGTPFRTVKLDFVFHKEISFLRQVPQRCDCEHFFPSPNAPLIAN